MKKEAIFVGFFPKITSPAPDWLTNKKVREVCSVGNCISEGPEGWLELSRHNSWGFYDTEDAAWKIAGSGRRNFDLYAYRLFPFRSLAGKMEDLDLPPCQCGAFPEEFCFLGHDVVTKSESDFFECSPLSCNNASQNYPVNEFCLIVDYETACRALAEISREGSCEPGPYYLFEVYRKPRSPKKS